MTCRFRYLFDKIFRKILGWFFVKKVDFRQELTRQSKQNPVSLHLEKL